MLFILLTAQPHMFCSSIKNILANVSIYFQLDNEEGYCVLQMEMESLCK